MRLIDADKFIEDLGLDEENAREDNLGELVTLEDFDRQPAIFDIDNVVGQLEEYIKESSNADYNRAMIEAIEVIKAEIKEQSQTARSENGREINIQQAIHCLKNDYDKESCVDCKFYHNCTHETRTDIARTAVAALEKQMPKKPVDALGVSKNGRYCPGWHQKLEKHIDKYCNECGQALDWSRPDQ